LDLGFLVPIRRKFLIYYAAKPFKTPFFLIYGSEAMLSSELKAKSTRAFLANKVNQEQQRIDDLNTIEGEREAPLI
jgi:hypothetical protein